VARFAIMIWIPRAVISGPTPFRKKGLVAIPKLLSVGVASTNET
jgi:hypothetical protein